MAERRKGSRAAEGEKESAAPGTKAKARTDALLADIDAVLQELSGDEEGPGEEWVSIPLSPNL